MQHLLLGTQAIGAMTEQMIAIKHYLVFSALLCGCVVVVLAA